mmetsp:Transcript_174147/g.558408  ORF Transcript_174147/g.558408 Transcript_174147/m.558408 type:complete len:264 (-) Transcript_174147:752-1543(-)
MSAGKHRPNFPAGERGREPEVLDLGTSSDLDRHRSRPPLQTLYRQGRDKRDCLGPGGSEVEALSSESARIRMASINTCSFARIISISHSNSFHSLHGMRLIEFGMSRSSSSQASVMTFMPARSAAVALVMPAPAGPAPPYNALQQQKLGSASPSKELTAERRSDQTVLPSLQRPWQSNDWYWVWRLFEKLPKAGGNARFFLCCDMPMLHSSQGQGLLPLASEWLCFASVCRRGVQLQLLKPSSGRHVFMPSCVHESNAKFRSL